MRADSSAGYQQAAKAAAINLFDYQEYEGVLSSALDDYEQWIEEYGYRDLLDLLKANPDSLDDYDNESVHVAFDGLPALKKFFGDDLKRYWPGLYRIGMVCGGNAGLVFRTSIPKIKELLGNDFDACWPYVVQMCEYACEGSRDLLDSGIRQLAKSTDNIPELLPACVDICREAHKAELNEHSYGFFFENIVPEFLLSEANPDRAKVLAIPFLEVQHFMEVWVDVYFPDPTEPLQILLSLYNEQPKRLSRMLLKLMNVDGLQAKHQTALELLKISKTVSEIRTEDDYAQKKDNIEQTIANRLGKIASSPAGVDKIAELQKLNYDLAESKGVFAPAGIEPYAKSAQGSYIAQGSKSPQLFQQKLQNGDYDLSGNRNSGLEAKMQRFISRGSRPSSETDRMLKGNASGL